VSVSCQQACQVFLAEKNLFFLISLAFFNKKFPISQQSSDFASFCVDKGFKNKLILLKSVKFFLQI